LTRALADRAANGAGLSRAGLVSTYFDTADRALARRGLSLRVRERDGNFVQTVKSTASGFGLARGEWEDAIAGAEPDPDAPETGDFLAPDITGRLTPLFRTEIDRRTIDLAPAPGACIEAAIDRGRVYAPARDAEEPVSELELELKSGPPSALYDVALALVAVAPVRLERRSKSERGYRLAAEAAPVAAAHAASIDLDPELSGDETLRRIGLACLDQILGNEAAVLAGLSEGIHQMRVAVRRLRAILSAFGRMLPSNQRRLVSAELRWLADALGPARNLDVFATALVAPAAKALAEPDGIAALAAAAERRRKAAYAEAAEAVRSVRYTGLMLRQLRWFDASGWRESPASQELRGAVAGLAPRILDRRQRIVKGRAKGFARQSARQRHKLRIALKKLRYATDMLAGIYDSDEFGRFTRLLKRLQDDLGDANDLRVGHAIVAELDGPGSIANGLAHAGEAMLAWHEDRLAARERKLRKHLDRLGDAEPFWKS
jgi:triphosphatase